MTEVQINAEAPQSGNGFRAEMRRARRVMIAARWPVFAVLFLLVAAIAATLGDCWLPLIRIAKT